MELLQLKYFCALAETQKLVATANHLMISPPSLSQTIRKLEQEVGVPLFDRVGRDIRLNPSGEIFLAYVSRSLDFLESGITEAVSAGDGPEELTIWYCNLHLWQDLIEEFQNSHKEIQVRTSIVSSPEKIGKMRYELFLGNYFDVEKYDLEYHKLFDQEKMYILMNAGHHLAGKEVLHLEELEQEVIFTFGQDVDSSKHDIIEQLVKYMSKRPKTIEGDYMLRYELLRKNRCITLTTDIGLRAIHDLTGLRVIPLDSPVKIRRMQVLAWNRERPLRGNRKLFYEYIRNTLETRKIQETIE